MMRALCRLVVRLLPAPRIIFDREGNSPYLSRHYILGAPYMADGSPAIDQYGNPKRAAIFPDGLGLYLHHFHRSDSDQALHNHPWRWAWSLILAGGYSEERRVSIRGSEDGGPEHEIGDTVIRRNIRPGRVIRINADDFHRVDLFEEDSWSLFLAGPKNASWGFWDRHTGVFMHWRAFIAKVRGPKWDGGERAS
jgi:hypothetical protein